MKNTWKFALIGKGKQGEFIYQATILSQKGRVNKLEINLPAFIVRDAKGEPRTVIDITIE